MMISGTSDPHQALLLLYEVALAVEAAARVGPHSDASATETTRRKIAPNKGQAIGILILAHGKDDSTLWSWYPGICL